MTPCQLVECRSTGLLHSATCPLVPVTLNRGGRLVATYAPDGKRSETPFNGTGDVFVDLTDGSVWVWTHSEGARPDRGGLVVGAKEQGIAQLNQKIAALEQQLAAGAGQDDVAVAAVKALALALASVSTSGTSGT